MQLIPDAYLIRGLFRSIYFLYVLHCQLIRGRGRLDQGNQSYNVPSLFSDNHSFMVAETGVRLANNDLNARSLAYSPCIYLITLYNFHNFHIHMNNTYVYTCKYTHTLTYTHTYIHTYVCLCVYVCMYVYTYVCICVCS